MNFELLHLASKIYVYMSNLTYQPTLFWIHSPSSDIWDYKSILYLCNILFLNKKTVAIIDGFDASKLDVSSYKKCLILCFIGYNLFGYTICSYLFISFDLWPSFLLVDI